METIVKPLDMVSNCQVNGSQNSCGDSAMIWCSCNGMNTCPGFI